MQRRERMFVARDSRTFRTLQWKKSKCAKLAVGGEVVQDPEVLLQVWVEHFQKLMKSRVERLCVEWGSTNTTGTSVFKISHKNNGRWG